MKRYAIATLALLSLLAADSRADIYRWEDEAGTVHFTDDISNIPAAFRGKAKMVIREAPRPEGSPPPAPAGQGTGQPPSAPPPAASPEDPAAAAAREREEVASQVEQVKAKIAAKEKLVQFVEDRQNLVLNPDRRRVLDPGDLELYKKYQEELPQDRQTLEDLENRLESLK
jgi:hypothetical protein